MEKLALVIVTYKRQQLLDQLLESVLLLGVAPWRVYIIDNENSEETEQLISVYGRLVDEGLTAVPWEEGADTFVYKPMIENTGGAGGFSEGVRLAYEDGAQWFWLMDDDVVVYPDSIADLDKWTDRFDVIQGSRHDFDGGAFYWQYKFNERLGVYDPFAPSAFPEEGWKPMNALCFEGALFNRRIVDAIGLPDARFFIYWDDCVYGYLASKVGRAAHVSDVVMRRNRNVGNWEIGSVRQLNSSSNMTRWHIMRNRGHMYHYMKMNGDYDPIAFGAGTVLCFLKEIVRLASVDKVDLREGTKSLIDGWKSARRIIHDDNWKPYRFGD